MEVEYKVSITIFPRHCVGPKFFHEEDLVGKLRRSTCGRKSLVDNIVIL